MTDYSVALMAGRKYVIVSSNMLMPDVMCGATEQLQSSIKMTLDAMMYVTDINIAIRAGVSEGAVLE